MIIESSNKELKRLMDTGKTNDKLLRDRKILRENFQNVIMLMLDAECPADLYRFSELHFEPQKGTNRYSIKIGNKYRLEFLIDKVRHVGKDVYICTIIEISNHYGGKKRRKKK